MLKIENVVKKYENGYVALKGVSFETPDSGFIAITGASGSGKSTLLNLLACNDSITGGRIAFNGISYDNLSKEERYSDFAYIYQDYKLIENITVFDNMLISAELSCYEADEKRIDDILTELGLIEFKREKVTNLSGGQKQRVAIARALVRQPKVIFADEPTGNLDSENTRNIFSILKELSKTVLVILVTHDVETVMEYADRIIKLCDGKIESNEIVKNSNETEKPLSVDGKIKKNRKLSIRSTARLGIAFNNSKILKRLALITMSTIMIMMTLLTLTWSMLRYDKAVFATVKNSSNNSLTIAVNNEKKYKTDRFETVKNYFMDISELSDYMDKNLKIKNARVYRSSNAYVNKLEYSVNNLDHKNSVQNLYNNYLFSTPFLDYIISDNIEELNLKLVSGRQPIAFNECLIPISKLNAMLEVVFINDKNNYFHFDSIQSIYDYDFNGMKIVGAFDDYLSVDDKYKNISCIAEEYNPITDLKILSEKQLSDEIMNLTKYINNQYLTNCVIMSSAYEKYLNDYQYYSNRNTSYQEYTLNINITNTKYTGISKEEMIFSFLPANQNTKKVTGIDNIASGNIYLSQNLLNIMTQETDNSMYKIGDEISLSTIKGALVHSQIVNPSIINSKTFTIAGILPNLTDNTIIFNNEDYKYLTDNSILETNYIYFNDKNLTLNKLNKIRNFVTKHYIDASDLLSYQLGITYNHNNDDLEEQYYFSKVIGNYIAIPLTIIMAVLFILFVFNTYSNTIKSKAGELLILKSLGAKKTEFLKIFSIHSIIFALIEILLGIGLGLGAVAFVDNVICKKIAGGIFTVFSFDTLAISIVIAMVFIVNIIALIIRTMTINDKNLRKAFQKSKE